MSENGEIYTTGNKFYTPAGTDGMDKFHLWQGACAVAQMSWKYPRRPPNSHEYPPWRMMRVWAVKYVHLGSSENPKTHHIQHTSQQLQILCQFSSTAPTKSSRTLEKSIQMDFQNHMYIAYRLALSRCQFDSGQKFTACWS